MRLKYKYIALAVAVGIALPASFMGLAPAIECPFWKYLRICCPMCGTTRAWKSLLYFHNLSHALRYNPLFLVWGLMVALSYLDVIIRAFDITSTALLQSFMKQLSNSSMLWYMYCVLLALVTIYLNLPVTRNWRNLTDLQLSF